MDGHFSKTIVHIYVILITIISRLFTYSYCPIFSFFFTFLCVILQGIIFVLLQKMTTYYPFILSLHNKNVLKSNYYYSFVVVLLFVFLTIIYLR
jgi:hypothetical protein